MSFFNLPKEGIETQINKISTTSPRISSERFNSTSISSESLHQPNSSSLKIVTRNSNSVATFSNNNQTSIPIIHSNHAVRESHTNTEAGEGSCKSTFQNYGSKEDYKVTSKPPLPISVNRPPSRFSSTSQNNSAQKVVQLGSSTTPRMKIPTSVLPITTGGFNKRPPPPLTNGFRENVPKPPENTRANFLPSVNKSQSKMGSPVFNNETQRSTNDTSQFHYNGPHQIYEGPTTMEGQDEGLKPLNWLLNGSENTKPNLPLPGGFEDIHSQTQSSLTSKNNYCRNLNKTETEQEVMINMIEEMQQASSFESHSASMLLLTSPSAPGSQSPSFPSSLSLARMEALPLVSSTGNAGHFMNSGIPSEIQDDLLRIEMLLELRKYKQALNKKIQNQKEILQLVNSGGHLNSSPQFQNPQRFNNPKSSHNLDNSQHQQQYQPQRHKTLSVIMDPPLQPSNSGSLDGVLGSSEEKWPDFADSLNSPNFVLNTFMEPHHILHNAVSNHISPASGPRQTQYSSNNDVNDKSPINLLQTRNFDEFQAMAEQSRSGFPMEMINPLTNKQNPLLTEASQYQRELPTYPLLTAMSTKTDQKSTDATRAIPLQVQVEQRNSSSQLDQHNNQSTAQQYQRYLLDKSFQNLSPNSFKMMEPMGRTSMLRKPVAVLPNNLFPINDSPSNHNATMTISDNSSGRDVNRPSPYFPGFSGSPINMKIRSPEEVSQRTEGNGSSEAENHLEGVVELGNLLRQLPVLTRKEKVEEFQALSTLKSVTPVTEAESETSMIPLVSSNGTLISEKRPDSVETKLSKTMDAENEFRNVDPNKLNINELVTLGRKIYRILSQLSTTPTVFDLNSTTPQVVTTSMTLDVPSPNTPVFTSKSNKGLTKESSTSSTNDSPQMIVDFNTIPNPTFITGPGLNNGKSILKNDAVSSHRSRTPNRPPNLFRRILQPPPTRWERNNRSSSMNNPSPSNSVRLAGFESPHKQSLTYKQRQSQPRAHFSRRSMNSLTSVPGNDDGGGVERPESRTYENTVLKMVSLPPQKATTSIRIAPPHNKLPDSFSVREKYNNNSYSTKSMPTRYKHRRQATPHPFQQVESLEVDSRTSMGVRNINTTIIRPSVTRANSAGRRNFIQENISKLRTMKKLPDHRVRPRQLPPVSKKRYENVPSTIPGSRSRSNSYNRKDDYHDYTGSRYRSSSVPVTTSGGDRSPSSRYPNRSVSTPRPSTGMSVHVASSKSRSSTQIRPTSSARPFSQGILRQPIAATMKGSVKSRLSTKAISSKVKFGKLPSKSSVGIVGIGNAGSSFEENKNNLRLEERKSRSKTKRNSNQQKTSIVNSRNSSVSSIEQQQPPQKQHFEKKKSKKEQRQKLKKPVIIGETMSTEDEAASVQEPLFKSESEQRMIREMVKAEMSLMVEMHVKQVLKEQKSRSREEDSGNNYHRREAVADGLSEQQNRHHYIEKNEEIDEVTCDEVENHSSHPISDSFTNDNVEEDHDDTTGIDSENITPVYTPPKYYDESLFSLEKWINPDGHSLPGSAPASAKEITRENLDNVVDGDLRNAKVTSKPQTVRFSLPNSRQHLPPSNTLKSK